MASIPSVAAPVVILLVALGLRAALWAVETWIRRQPVPVTVRAAVRSRPATRVRRHQTVNA